MDHASARVEPQWVSRLDHQGVDPGATELVFWLEDHHFVALTAELARGDEAAAPAPIPATWRDMGGWCCRGGASGWFFLDIYYVRIHPLGLDGLEVTKRLVVSIFSCDAFIILTSN